MQTSGSLGHHTDCWGCCRTRKGGDTSCKVRAGQRSLRRLAFWLHPTIRWTTQKKPPIAVQRDDAHCCAGCTKGGVSMDPEETNQPIANQPDEPVETPVESSDNTAPQRSLNRRRFLTA